MKTVALALLAATTITLFQVAARAADLPASPTAAPSTSTGWDGAYIGGNVGYVSGTAFPTGPSVPTSGSAFGGQIGYSFDIVDPLIFGVQANVDWTDENGNGVTHRYGLDWDSSVVGRLGANLGQLMPYVEGGVAAGGGVRTLIAPPGTVENATYFGWTLGAGLQVMFADKWSGDLEYRHTNYGTQLFGGAAVPVGLADNTVSVGIDYHF